MLEIFRDVFDLANRERELFLLTMHPYIIGHRSRLWVVEELIKDIRGHDGVCFATHGEVARYCLATA